MTRRIRRRGRGLVSGLAATVVAAAVAGPIGQTAAQALTRDQGLVAPVTVPAATTPPDPAIAASQSARASGQPVTVDALTTETSQTVANADGSFTWTGNTAPVRVKRGGAWTPVNSNLAVNADGTYSAIAVPGNLVFGKAGSTTLAAMTDESGHTLTYTWPVPLPAPTVTGATALYPNVWPGIDLSLTAGETGSFEDTLVIHNASAAKAASSVLASLRMGVATSAGLSASADATGNTKVADASGNTVFAFGAPQMWDSAVPTAGSPAAQASAPTTGEASDAHHPGFGAHRALMKASVANSAVDISANLSTLAGGNPAYPIYLDPVTVPNNGQYGWDEVQEAYPTVSNYSNTSVEDLGVGYEGASCPCGRERAYYGLNMPSAAVWSDKITSAMLYTTQDYAANTADSTNIYLETSAPIGSGTTWNAQPGFSWVATSSDPTGSSNGVSFDFTGFADNTIRANHWSSWTFMLYNANETGSFNYFKRFKYNPTISLTYDNAPTIGNYSISPTPYKTIGGTGTCPYADGGWLSHQSGSGFQPTVTVSSNSNPQNTLGVNYWMLDNTSGGWYWGPNPISSGNHTSGSPVPGPVANSLSEGHKYTWWADAYDNTIENIGEKSSQCSFTVDTVPPDSLQVTSSDFPQSGSGSANKGINTSGSFTLSAHDGTSGVWCFEYAIDGYLSTSATPCGSGNSVAPGGPWGSGTATTSFTWNGSPVWGTHFITVVAVDQAGNRSAGVTYPFYLVDNPNAKAVQGDVNGDGSPDLLAVDNSGNLKLYNQTKDPGAGGVLAAAAADGPGAGGTWKNTILAHRGSLTGTRWDDLWAWTPNNPSTLYLYSNNPTTPGTFSKANSIPMARPDCSANNVDANANTLDASFACYQATPGATGQNNYAADWHNVLQFASIGVIKGIGADTNASLVTIESDGHGNADLWLYPAITTRTLGFPYLLSTSTTANWANYDITAPGDLTGDGVPDLWVRDRSTGKIYTLPITIGTESVTNGSITVPAPVAGTMTPAGALDPATYPQITSIGDIDGSGHADLFAGTLYGNTLTEYPGTGSSGVTSGFGPAVTVTPTNWTGTVADIEGGIRTPSVGSLQLTSIAGPKCADNGGGTTNGSIVLVYGCNHTYPQTWSLNSDGTIRPGFETGKCLDIVSPYGPATDSGTKVQLWDCNGQPQQQWQLRSDTSIFNPSSGKCLDDPNYSTTNGTQFQIWDCGSDSNGIDSDTAQQWTPPSGSPAAAPVSLWQANDTGSVAADTMSNHNLALHGTINRTSGATGQPGDTALGFTGAGSYGDSGAALINTSQSYTVSAWVNLTSTANGWQDIITQDGSSISGMYLQYDPVDNRWSLASMPSDSTSATTTRVLSPAAPTTGTWTMVTGVYDQANNVMKLYINGAFVADVWPAPGTFTASGHTVVGRGLWGGSQVDWFQGSIDNARVYNTALTDAQISALYTTGS